jgi:signal transduction histidine kinase
MSHSTAQPTLDEQHAPAAPQAAVAPVTEARSTGLPAEVVLRRLAACMAHHVNNALTGVIGYLELGLRDVGSRGNHQAHLQEGLACAYQAAETVKRLVAFASEKRPSAGRRPVSLRRVAEKAASDVQTACGPSLSVTVTGDEDVPVLADAGWLGLTVEQIVRNGVEAMPYGGTLVLRLECHGGEGRLHISDSGAGLSAEAAAHLFDPFWTTKPNGHLGLGLVLSRDMMTAQGGSLTVQSTPGAGTTVTLSLPAPSDRAAAEPDQSEAATVLAPTSGTLMPTPH